MSEVIIYKTPDKKTNVEVQFEGDTVWLTQAQLTELYNSSKANISEHLKSIFNSGELNADSTVRNFRTVRKEGKRQVARELEHYNLDVIISLGYRINTARGIQFRQWATQRLNDYLVKGYAINEHRLKQKQQEAEYLKTGIRILSRDIEEKSDENSWLKYFSKGLQLLDDYDHQKLDTKGNHNKKAKYPELEDYFKLINLMKSEFKSDLFGKEKDKGFESAVAQITKGFGKKDFYLTIEEKAAMLLYLIVKNHSFVDGNKRIAAACFLQFLNYNKLLNIDEGNSIINNDALASVTLFVASSKPEEKDMVIQLIVSILNRNEI